MKHYILILIAILSLNACKKRDNRKVIETKMTPSAVKKEDNTVDIADLPIYIDSTNYIIHPIGNYKIQKSRAEYFSGADYYSGDYRVANFNGYKIAGDLSNVKFQKVNSDVLKPLTNEVIKIHQMSFLFMIFEDTKNGFYVYDVIDKDTNANGKLDQKDLKSIYVSDIDGSIFKRISPQLQDLVQWKEMVINKRLYFKTLEDTDNNGEFNKKDTMHYFYLELNKADFEVVEYFPID
ncbi:hypothetical protein [Psychroserpens sp. Hel_I_66]|uniref:hypothetical protein n=1 Tax=Psychroserpens sp. Hel_I_66 TaxID=1250004 RepID=UPI0006473686|nr:hypothetical protein [Psychroserpens sp. Hel_I_66]